MSAIRGYVCDLCGTEERDPREHRAASPFRAHSFVYSRNPLGHVGYPWQKADVDIKDCCPACAKALAEALARTIAELAGKEIPEVLS